MIFHDVFINSKAVVTAEVKEINLNNAEGRKIAVYINGHRIFEEYFRYSSSNTINDRIDELRRELFAFLKMEE